MKIIYDASGLPRNVPKKEYSRHTLFVFATVASLGMGLISAVVLISGMAFDEGERLNALPSMTEAMVSGLKTAPKTAFKFEGILTGDQVPMKDDKSPVLYGRYDVILRGSKKAKGKEKFRHVLHSWKSPVPTLRLKLGEQVLALKVNEAQLPFITDKKARAKLNYEGSLRNRGKAISVEYGGESFALDSYKLEKQDFVTTELERSYMKDGEPVLVVAHIEKGAKGWELSGPQGHLLEMHRGHQKDLKAQSQTRLLVFLVFAVLCFVVGGLLFKKVQRDRGDFARRSQE